MQDLAIHTFFDSSCIYLQDASRPFSFSIVNIFTFQRYNGSINMNHNVMQCCPGSPTQLEVAPGSGSRTLPPAVCPTGPWPGSRSTDRTSSRRSIGFPAATTIHQGAPQGPGVQGLLPVQRPNRGSDRG